MSDRSKTDPGDEPTPSEGLAWGCLGSVLSFVAVVLLGLVIYGVTLAAASDEQRAAREASDALQDEAAGGRGLYERHCAQCHGRRGEGVIGPSFSGVKSRYPTAEAQEELVTAGKDRMPSFEGVLTAEEISAVVAYEREVLDGQ